MIKPNDVIQQKMAGKRILFVEDRPSTISSYREELEMIPDLKVEYVDTLEKACMLFEAEKESPPFDIVLIDLNLPPVPKSLAMYAERLEADDLNEGQALGLWLSDKHPQIRYAYLTALSAVLDKEVDPSQAKIEVIDKNLVMPIDLPEKLYQIWAQWEDGEN